MNLGLTEHKNTSQLPKILITGGSGFLGKAIVKELLAVDSPFTPARIIIFDITEYKGIADPRIHWIKGDIRNAGQVSESFHDIDIVIHSAAIVDWGTKSDQEINAVNVSGTENVIRGCLEQKVGLLIYTSSLDAIFGGRPLTGINETIPYPRKHPNSYCRSKYLSEKIVIAVNGCELKTCVLRPAYIYGEGDRFHIVSLIDMAKNGFYIRLGNGKAKSQHVYLGNIAWAHILAASALWNGNTAVAGNIFFITDGVSSNFFKFFDRFVEGSGYRIWPENLWIPKWMAYSLGYFSELLAKLVRPISRYRPKLTRFAVAYTCSNFTFSADKAKNILGFIPKYSEKESFDMTVGFFKRIVTNQSL